MPGGDRTGPQGMGPKTGRAMGYCTGYDVPGSVNPNSGQAGGFGAGRQGGRGMAYGRGRGAGAGRGRGWRGQSFTPVDVNAENVPVEQTNVQDLMDSLNKLQRELAGLHERISNLERT